MSRYRIVCVESEYFERGKHDHLTAVGTGTDSQTADKKWTIDDVRSAVTSGDKFYTQSPSTGTQAKVEKFTCSACEVKTIRSNADHIEDNNLDDLRTCRKWQS